MTMSRALLAALLASATLTTNPACADAGPPPKKEQNMESAKRRAPSARPIEHQGVRYEQMRRPKEHGFTQSGGVIAAVDEATAKQLWAVQLYETVFDPAEEQDAQEVYVSQLSIDAKAGVLKAVDERKRVWLIKLSDHSVTRGPDAAH